MTSSPSSARFQHSTRSQTSATSQLTTQFLTVDGGTLAYDESGSGPLVICLPSLGDVRAEYRFLRPQLVEAGFHVVTMDLRGHGEASVHWPDYSKAAIGSDIIALIRHLDAGPALLVATSYAGGSAVWAASEVPDLVVGLVLIGAFVRDASGGGAQKVMLDLLFRRPWGPTMWDVYFSRLYPSQKPRDFKAYRTHLKDNLREHGRMEALQAMLDDPNQGIEPRLDRVSAPTLVMMGTKDPDFKDPQAEARFIAEHTRGTVELVQGAGHYPHAEMPDQAGPDIVHFLERVRKPHAS